jgi:hypothetical protein
MLIKEAKAITGGIGFTSKTGFAFGLPARTACKVGCKLADKEGSTCFGCYARGGNYSYPSTKQAHSNRWSSVQKLHDESFRKLWVEAMVTLINNKAEKAEKDELYFRWHDSGDINDINHLKAIVAVAKKTPEVKHWIPTKEVGTVKAFLKNNKIPSNLCIRLSVYFVDDTKGFDINLPKARVYKNSKPQGKVCQAVLEHKGCKEVGCRACWNKRVRTVNYKHHR